MSDSRSDLLDRIERGAKEAELRYHGCGRSILHGLKQHFDFITDEVITAATALAGGCGYSLGSCGAYCGGLLAIGLKYNAPIEDQSPEALAKRDLSRRKESEFRDLFVSELGSTVCKDLQERQFGRSYRLWDEKERQEFMELPSHFEKCSEIVAKAARLAAETMLRE